MTEPIVYPHNIKNEQLVLAYLFRDNFLYWKVNSFLKDHHFHQPVHQRIYAAFGEALQLGAVNPFTMAAQFDGDEHLKDIGGAQYMARLLSTR